MNGIRLELLPRAIGKLLGDLTRVPGHGQLRGACVGGQLHQLIDAQAGRRGGSCSASCSHRYPKNRLKSGIDKAVQWEDCLVWMCDTRDWPSGV